MPWGLLSELNSHGKQAESKSPEALCRKCLNLKTNLKATSEMETLLFKLVKSESSHASLRPIYKVFESTERIAVTKEDLIKAIGKVAGATSLWSRLWSDRLKQKDPNKPVTVHPCYSAAVCMLANSFAIPLSNGSKKDRPDPTCDKPKATSRIRTQHKAKSGREIR